MGCLLTKLFLTGATGFIGQRFLESVLLHTDWNVVSLERLPKRDSIFNGSTRAEIFYHDLRAEIPSHIVSAAQECQFLVHLAGEVSGIKSLANPELTVATNVWGTYHVLELARKMSILERLIYVSTGEVVGNVNFPGQAAEDVPLFPSNPYAASKAAGEALVNAYRVSFGVPGIIVRSMNVFGERQSTDRFIPMVLRSIIDGHLVTCHVDRQGNSGSRNWLYVNKFVSELEHLVDYGKVGEIYHIVGPERTNLDIIRLLCQVLGQPLHVHTKISGPSHDFRYSLKDTKLGLNFDADFNKTIELTIRSYLV